MKSKTLQARIQKQISNTASHIRELEVDKEIASFHKDSPKLKLVKQEIKQLAGVQKLLKDVMQNVYWKGQ